MQLAIAELTEGRNPTERKIFREIQISSFQDVSAAARGARQFLGITAEQQFSWKDSDEALKQWRNRIEDAGIFVFKRSFKQRDISGFCIADAEMPLIYLNNSTTKNRQIFSLAHELAHALFPVSGISKFNDEYVRRLPPQPRHIEVICNRFAAELLVPDDLFARVADRSSVDERTVSSIANRFKVSREVILRRFLDHHWLSAAEYEATVAEWTEQFRQSEEEREGGGGDYYKTHAAYLGDKFLSLVFRGFYQGRLSVDQVADYLGVRSKSVAGLEHEFMRHTRPQ